MKILRNVILCVLFVVAVFISSANVQLVEIVYLPATGFESGWRPRTIQLPLFVIILGALGIGAMLGGAGGLFEQGRLRLALRRARKAEQQAATDRAEAETSAARERESVERLRVELQSARTAEAQARRSPSGSGTPPSET